MLIKATVEDIKKYGELAYNLALNPAKSCYPTYADGIKTKDDFFNAAERAIAKESHVALIDYMREFGIKRPTAGTALNNTPSVALLKSLGFELIETEKVSFYKDADGKDIVFDGGVFELLL